MAKPPVDLTVALLFSAILAMVWRYHWRTLMDGDTLLGAIDSEISFLTSQHEEKKQKSDPAGVGTRTISSRTHP